MSLAMHVEQKKGNPEYLKGKLIAYVHVHGDMIERPDAPNPLAHMVRNGILAIQANYVDQRNIRDFFRAEFGVSLEKGIQEVIEQAKDMGGLEGALDPEAVRERLESMKNADFIPIPAKVAYFNSEEEMMHGEADVFYLGVFTVLSHAHLCVNSFPIMYQACFREQEHRALENEIALLLNNIEDPRLPAQTKHEEIKIQTYKGDIKTFLLKELLPKMIYSREDKNEYSKALEQFQTFMSDFGYPEDTQQIVQLIESGSLHNKELQKLELLVAKVEALQKEDYEKLEQIKKQIALL